MWNIRGVQSASSRCKETALHSPQCSRNVCIESVISPRSPQVSSP